MSEAEHTGVLLDGRYRVGARLGQGGMGTVYAAEHVGLGQRRAIKFLRPDIARKPGSVKRFLQEARALSAMHHDNLVGVVDMGKYEGSAYYVMEFLEGEDLRSRLRRRGPLSWPQTRTVALQVCEALQQTHARGIVHRDIKPENCFCVRTEPQDGLKIKVIDFGVAKVPKEAGGTSQLTGSGETLGTIGYMAPEQLEGKGDHRVDVYSLGTMIFEMLAGRPVYSGNAFEVITKMLRGEATTLRSACAEIDPTIEQLIDKATHKDPAERFGSMEAFAAAISAIPMTAEPQTAVDRRDIAPDPSRAGASVDVAATTMQGSEPALQETVSASDTDGAEDHSPSGGTERVSAIAAVAPAVTVNTPPRRRAAPWAAVAALLIAGVVWITWPSHNEPAEPVAIASTRNAETVNEEANERKTSADTTPGSGGDAPPNDAKDAMDGMTAPGDGEMPDVEGKALTVGGSGTAVAGSDESKGVSRIGSRAPASRAETSPPAIRLLGRDALKRRLGSELGPCRSKFADDVITIRVTPGKGGKIDKLASVYDTQLAPGTIRCIEKELARLVATIKEGVDTKKTIDVSLTLTKQ